MCAYIIPFLPSWFVAWYIIASKGYMSG